jgi:hypothetical protein
VAATAHVTETEEAAAMLGQRQEALRAKGYDHELWIGANELAAHPPPSRRSVLRAIIEVVWIRRSSPPQIGRVWAW